jgi:membrane protease YdiL (CAAX protease family)
MFILGGAPKAHVVCQPWPERPFVDAICRYLLVGTTMLVWFSIVTSQAYERTGTLLVPILVHVVSNGAMLSAHLRMAE